MSFWALASNLLLAASAGTQAYGRFGQTSYPSIPGFTFTQSGFRVDDSAGDEFSFFDPIQSITPAFVNDRRAEYLLSGGPATPDRLLVDLRSPGLQLRSKGAINLLSRSITRPVLTVDEASYNGKPTPSAGWVLLTLPKQPPVLFAFLDGQASLQVTGQPGAWQIGFKNPYRGWVRICQPFGIQTPPSDLPLVDVLGFLGRKVSKGEFLWRSPLPRALGQTISQTEDSLTVSWQFDRAGFLIPPALAWAEKNQLGVRFLSRTKETEGIHQTGPLRYSAESDLKVEFKIRPPRIGRSLTLGGLGGQMGEQPAASLANAAWPLLAASLSSSRIASLAKVESALNSQSIGSLSLLPRPMAGVESAALALNHALLTSGERSERLAQLIWRRDWWTLRLWGVEPGLDEAGALTAAALWQSKDPNWRLEGALLWAGIAAAQPITDFRRSIGLPATPPAIQAEKHGFASLYRPQDRFENPWMKALLSPVTVLDDRQVLARKEGSRTILTWNHEAGAPTRIKFHSSADLTLIEVKNVLSSALVQTGNTQELHYLPIEAGPCEMELIGPPLPWTPKPEQLNSPLGPR